MKSPTIPQKKMETLKHRRWTGMSIDPIGPFDKSVEGNHQGLVARHTQDVNDAGETTNGSNFLIILGMTTKAEAPNAVFIGLVINENDLIMKAIDIEPQAFKDLVYDTVRRKTIPRGAEIIYSHIVFDKKYKIDPETKRNVFLKWKARLVFDGSKQKSYEDTFSPTPSLPMIRTLLAECCTTEWEVRHKDL